MRLTRRVNRIKTSPTLEITSKAKAMKAQGIDVVNFGAGEPDFDTPDSIKNAAIDAIKKGYTKYTPVGGIDPLKETICAKLKRDNGLHYEKNEIIVSCGAKHSLYGIAQALFEEGDAVLIPVPYWVSYPDQLLLAGASPAFVTTTQEDNFLLTPESFKESITENTRALILNSPSNPTGAAYSRQSLEKIATIALDNNITIISDEIYEKITYDDFSHLSIAHVSSEMKRKTIIVNGVSKAYSMTGWRIGYAAADKTLIAAITKIQSQSTSNPTSISQYAAIEALQGDQSAVSEMKNEFQKRRDYIVQRLNAIDGISCRTPQGAFYVFPDVSKLYNNEYKGKRVTGSISLSKFFLENCHVAVVPGIAFGMDEHIRLSYATSMEVIKKGLDRIEAALQK